MASIERTAYLRFKRYYTLAQLQKIYTPSSTEIAFARSNTQSEAVSSSALVMDNPGDLINALQLESTVRI